MDLQAFYQMIDGDYQDTLKRLYSNDLILRFVWKFQDDPSFALLRDSIAAGDWGTAFRGAHTLKGVAQNLGFARLYRSSAALTEQLRGGQPLREKRLWEDVKKDYAQVIAAIASL